MRTRPWLWLCGGISCFALIASPEIDARQGRAFTTEFNVDKSDLATTGRNPYFVLEPGYTSEFAGGDVRLVITVTDDVKRVDGVDTRVVEERETDKGKLVEVSRNYFAISRRTGAVYYFGEDVDMYKDDKVVSHEGAWLAGVVGARFGLAMPGEILLGARYYQEIAPKVAMDRAEILSVTETVKTPAGEFKNCLKTEETTPIEPGTREAKYYARDVGLVQDGDVKLVRTGRVQK
jgi:hypothetical protein